MGLLFRFVFCGPVQNPIWVSINPSLVKNIVAILFSFLFYLPAHSTIKTVVGNTGTGWGNNANWSSAGVPVDGDEIIIPLGQTISVKGSFYTGTQNLEINVDGTLDFDPSGKLNLGSLSIVQQPGWRRC